MSEKEKLLKLVYDLADPSTMPYEHNMQLKEILEYLVELLSQAKYKRD
jgi:hypothetical protein